MYIAKDNNVSSTTIDRVLDEASNKYIIPGTLPQIMNIDEFQGWLAYAGCFTLPVSS